MDTLEAIRTRRSIRRYQAQAVREAELRTIVAAGMSAPSAGNEQPWHFIVILKKLFSLPEDVIPFALIPLGYPAQAYRSEDRFKPKRIHEAVW